MSDTPNLGMPSLRPAAPGRSTKTIILAVVLSAAVTLAVVCATLLLLGITPWSEDASLVQHGTVSSQASSGSVTYEVPYASLPQLSLDGAKFPRTSGRVEAKDRPFLILRNQTEAGFDWEDSSGKKGTAFRWEGKGRGRPGEVVLFVQKGSFLSALGEQGQVHFPHPYQTPPNVELNGRRTIVVEATTTSFKWKNTGAKTDFAEGNLEWVAKGVKAK